MINRIRQAVRIAEMGPQRPDFFRIFIHPTNELFVRSTAHMLRHGMGGIIARWQHYSI